MVLSKQFMKTALMSSALILLAPSVLANTQAAKEPVSVNLNTYLIAQNAEGKITEQVTSEVKPGQVVEYRAVYTNNTAGTIKNLVATLPIDQKNVDFPLHHQTNQYALAHLVPMQKYP